MRLDATAPVPLYQQVAADIRRRIVSGNMAVGVQIPPHKDLATEYGVSVITINKALSGLVSEGLLYSHVGRGTFVMVRPASTSGIAAPTTIGFVLRDLSSPFFSLVAHGAQQRADALGVGLLFASSSNRLDREEEQIKRLRVLGVHGFIIVSMSRTFRLNEAIQALHDSDFPYTMVSWTAGEDVPFVGLDLAAAGELAAEHLLSLGCRKFGYLIDSVGSLNGELRMSRYRAAIEHAGLEIDQAFVFEHAFPGEWNDYKSGYAAGEAIAQLTSRPEAMYCFNDLGALGLEDALLDAGLRVPGDVAIVGIDDIELAARARVPLTTIRQPVDIIGARSVDNVLARLRGERPAVRQLLPAELIVRASTGAPVAVAADE
ncbi:MAG TPA: GntR family transcriptional regulator [Gemmatimonadaceae bacterium]